MVVEQFGATMRENLTTGEIPFRKAYLDSLIDRVEVDDHAVRIVGRKDVLKQAVLSKSGPIPGVRSFVRKWRSLGEGADSPENITQSMLYGAERTIIDITN